MSCILKYITEIVDCVSILLLNNLTVPGLQQGQNSQKCTIVAGRWGGGGDQTGFQLYPGFDSTFCIVNKMILLHDIHPVENSRALEFGCLRKKKLN